jgi:hypothetical protein
VTVVRRGAAAIGLRATLQAEGLLGGPGDVTPIDSEYGDFGLTALRARVLHRAEAVVAPPALRRFWEAGATVFGPVLTGFAEWVAQRARELGAEEAFCLMRSGELLADLLGGPGRDAGVSARPLWASREVCALANVFEASPAELRAFLAHAGTGPGGAPGLGDTAGRGGAGQGGAVGTVGALLRRLRVDLAAVPGISALAGRRLDVPAGLLDEILDELLATLSEDDRVRGEIVLAAARLRERFLRYLDARLPEQGPAVLVDLGFDGVTQVLLARLLAATGREAVPVGLYLATGPGALEHRLAGHRLEGYLASGGQPARLAGPLLRAPVVVEQIALADAGALTSFDEDGAPLLGLGRASRTQVAQRQAVQDGIRVFQREWQRYRDAESADSAETVLPSLASDGARLALLRTLTRFVAWPTAAEAAAFGGWRHDGDDGPGAALVGDQDELRRRMPYLSPVGLAEVSPREAVWPAAVAAVSNRPLALVTELAAAAGLDPRALSAPAAAGPVEVYVDIGADFARGPKVTAVPYAGRDGLSLVRLRVEAVGARRLRVDPAGRRGLLRLDWLAFGFHVVGAGEPRRVTVTTFDGPAVVDSERGRGPGTTRLGEHRGGVGLELVGLRLLQANLAEILDDDPQLVYNLDLPGMPELGGTYAVDIEFAFGWMGIRGDPVAVPAAAPTGAAAGSPLPRRAARRVMRQLGGLR